MFLIPNRSGTIPENIFKMKRMSTFAASGNCFEGGFPKTICDAIGLETLVIAGLSGQDKYVIAYPSPLFYLMLYSAYLLGAKQAGFSTGAAWYTSQHFLFATNSLRVCFNCRN